MNAAKRIVICCDGTWNAPDENPTNAVKMVRAIRPIAADGKHQVVFYDQGLGINPISRLIAGTLGYGMKRNVLNAYRFIVHNYQPGDEVYVFGASRGAHTARALTGLIDAVGLVAREDLGKLSKIYRYYRTPEHKRTATHYEGNIRPDIRMLGVFDSVGARGAPLPLLNRLTRSWIGFYDTQISPSVNNAFQALALDERRHNYQPDLWAGSQLDKQHIEQCWFVGAHADVTGGYEESGLSDMPLQWMVNKAQALGLDFDEHYLAHHCKPDLKMTAHNSYSWSYRMLEKLGAKPELRQVYGDPQSSPINVSLHASVKQRMAEGTYMPGNPELVSESEVPQHEEAVAKSDVQNTREADRRAQERFKGGHIQAMLHKDKMDASCQLLDFSKEGARIQYQGDLLVGDRLSLDSELTGPTKARCVWKNGASYGLRFAA
ncbi:phospholipase effector Tle1 domain-containing protein [Shewanella cyperi]|uniref:DUF2235 domain-containing protein n=1 Tax=Shewanella cyperi TaxID=2814292 RepID=A0A974XKE2_9GAMM|nr:DUF2235 domain-containing protein [Shewanella cyperi]QSX30021.1 DUF2235 domain-containing protein [Shewanella cyperi]QSX40797.1 DUF2235 domain-containing protein [Shewanella cyperi]